MSCPDSALPHSDLQLRTSETLLDSWVWLGATVRHARTLGFLALGVAALGLLFQLLPATAQQTRMLFALFLPIHVGLAAGLHAVATVASRM